MSQELHDYISQARKKGFSDKDIYDQLIAAGWDITAVSKSLDIPMPKNRSYSLLVKVLLGVGVIVLPIISLVFFVGLAMSPSTSYLLLLMVIVPLILAVILLSMLIKSIMKNESKIGSIAIALVIFFICLLVFMWFG